MQSEILFFLQFIMNTYSDTNNTFITIITFSDNHLWYMMITTVYMITIDFIYCAKYYY
jgi:hypothetical protein